MSILDQAIKHKRSKYKSAPDGTGIYTVVDEKRQNGTLYKKSTLSNKVNGRYTTRTVQSYAPDGATVVNTSVYTITYDAMGGIVSEVIA